jgi:hypothetical protein
VIKYFTDEHTINSTHTVAYKWDQAALDGNTRAHRLNNAWVATRSLRVPCARSLAVVGAFAALGFDGNQQGLRLLRTLPPSWGLRSFSLRLLSLFLHVLSLLWKGRARGRYAFAPNICHPPWHEDTGATTPWLGSEQRMSDKPLRDVMECNDRLRSGLGMATICWRGKETLLTTSLDRQGPERTIGYATMPDLPLLRLTLRLL